MAEELKDAGFWLPSGFLADDFQREEGGGGGGADPCFPRSCPRIGSVATAESSDEEDSLAVLSRELSRDLLLQDKARTPPLPAGKSSKETSVAMCLSPQSTLCEVWSCNSSNGETSKGPSLVSSPLSSSLERRHREEESRRMGHGGADGDEKWAYGGRGVLGAPAKKPSPSPSSPAKASSRSYYVNPSLTPPPHYNLVGKVGLIPPLDLQEFQPLKQKHQTTTATKTKMRMQESHRSNGDGSGGTAAGRPGPQWSASGMRAVFLSPRSGRDSSGTGVFLPRMEGNAAELRKKPACSTVLLPARVVRALNLDLNEIAAKSRLPSIYVIAAVSNRGEGGGGDEAEASPPPPPRALPANSDPHGDVALPSEWTY
ncbi:unnamed protein product [Spirodela intermedia]|uniref:Uncharacterized protein n=1 Tax=Spirodela intermedia TaxID=51605 RepID=A0A7I8JJ38_SPIIN|nr:unnamed protein product [Spirodela intermedia]CAA6669432.1 unnamed protein product [Spirodela intermedia]